MFVIYDNTVAVAVGSLILLILSTLQARITTINVEKTSLNIAKKQATEFASWLEDDLETADVVFSDDSDGKTVRLAFNREGESGSLVGVYYELVSSRVLYDDNADAADDIPLYELRRKVIAPLDPSNPPTAGTLPDLTSGGPMNGRSPSLLSNFRVALLDEEGEEGATAAGEKQLRIQFSLRLPFEEERRGMEGQRAVGGPEEIHWGTTLVLRNAQESISTP